MRPQEKHESSSTPEARTALLHEGYSAFRHIVRTAILTSLIAGLAVWFARDAAPRDWLLLPIFFAAANVLEWAFHKGPMHRPVGPRLLYHNHTRVHHRAFIHTTMPIHNTHELGLIMMPWYTMLLLFVLASPIALAAAAWRGVPAAGVFYIGAVIYFLAYETMHALYHLPPAWLSRVHLGGRAFTALQAHPRHHHRLDRMSHGNFNVTIPFADTLFGTRERPTPLDQ